MKKTPTLILLFCVIGFCQAQEKNHDNSVEHKEKQQLNLYTEAFQLIEARTAQHLNALDPNDVESANYIKNKTFEELSGLRQLTDALGKMSDEKTGSQSDPLVRGLNEKSLKEISEWVDKPEFANALKSTPQVALRGARLMRVAGKFQESEQLYLAAVNQSTKDVELWREYTGFLAFLDKEKEAIQLLENETKKATTPLYKSLLLAAQGKVYLKKEDYVIADSIYQRAIEIQENLPKGTVSKSSIANILQEAAEVSVKNNDFENCESRLEKAANMLRESGPHDELLTALVNLAGYYESVQSLKKAETITSEAVDGYQQPGNDKFQTKPGKASAFALSGRLKELTGDSPNAKKHFEKALALYRELTNVEWFSHQPGLAGTLNDAAIFYAKTGDNEKALLYFNEALGYRESLSEKFPKAFLGDLATTLNNIGLFYEKASNHKKASEAYERALEVSRESVTFDRDKYLPDLALLLNNFGVFKTNKRDFKTAEAYLTEALGYRKTLSEKAPEKWKPDLAQTLLKLAELTSIMQDYLQSSIYYEQASSLAKELAEASPYVFSPVVLNNLEINYCIVLFRLLGTDPQPGHKEKALDLISGAQTRISGLEPNSELKEQSESLEYIKNLFESYQIKN